ncbi:ParB/RepB/Spo0J family partition protein [Amycolatopsis sacchari]|uniref:ParB/RepB/Spo0J family partition protein n=1 Tax=Amycolatopsis sacchari TaxID=115433 RepID=UPI003D71C5D8
MSNALQLAVRRELAEHRPVQTARIPLAKLRVHPRHVRRDLGDLSELAESLANDGQRQIITVERRGDFYQILDGHRRYGAATIAGLPRLAAEIVPARTDAEAMAIMLTTGVHTKPLSPAERRHAVRALIDEEHMPTAEVAARCGVTQATIRRWYHAEDTAPENASASPAPRAAAVPRPRRSGEKRPRTRRTTVGVSRLTGLADRWAERCAQGLPADQAQALLAEIRALAAGID